MTIIKTAPMTSSLKLVLPAALVDVAVAAVACGQGAVDIVFSGKQSWQPP
jgi:hypothetical protein